MDDPTTTGTTSSDSDNRIINKKVFSSSKRAHPLTTEISLPNKLMI